MRCVLLFDSEEMAIEKPAWISLFISHFYLSLECHVM